MDTIANNAKIIRGVGSAYVEFTLTEGQSIISTGGSLLYMKGNVSKGIIKLGKATSAIQRLFSGENLFLDVYTGTPSIQQSGGLFGWLTGNQPSPPIPNNSVSTNSTKNGGTIAFGQCLPGDIMMITIEPGESYLLSKGVFLACTTNINVSAGFRVRGLVSIGQDEGAILPKAECVGQEPGYVWVGGYGTLRTEELQAGESLLLNNGMFLACNTKVSYTLTTLGKTLLSSFFGGEGMGMKFVGPCTVHIQSQNVKDLVRYMALQIAPPKSVNTFGAESVASGIALFDALGELATDGGKLKAKSKSNSKKK